MQIRDLNPIEAERLSPWLDQALELLPEQRVAWLAELVRQHGSIALLVGDLLEAHDRARTSKLLEQSLDDVTDAIIGGGDAEFSPGTLIGPLPASARTWSRRHGSGVACRASRRRVYSPGCAQTAAASSLPSRPGRALSRERDILARLKHPNIALLYDAGIASKDQAYLALEYVDGTSITSYCNAHQLPLAARLRLFMQALDAVQFAHANLVSIGTSNHLPTSWFPATGMFICLISGSRSCCATPRIPLRNHS